MGTSSDTYRPFLSKPEIDRECLEANVDEWTLALALRREILFQQVL